MFFKVATVYINKEYSIGFFSVFQNICLVVEQRACTRVSANLDICYSVPHLQGKLFRQFSSFLKLVLVENRK